MLLQEPFTSGRLLLDHTPSDAVAGTSEGFSVLFIVLAVAFILAAIAFLPRFQSLAPLLFDSLFRARGSVSLENSVRASNDRRLVAIVLLLPASLLTYYYKVYDAAFLYTWGEEWRLLVLIGVFAVFALLRLAMYALLKPRRGNDFYCLSRRTAYTYFILLVVLALFTTGVLALFGCENTVIQKVLQVELLVLYFAFLVRRAQILALSCNPLRTFLYLCALEILPSSALIVSAIVL